MNQKHKEAFQELRAWCEKWDAELCLEDTNELLVNFINSKVFSLQEVFSKECDSAIELDDNSFENDKCFNFMEQEDDTEK